MHRYRYLRLEPGIKRRELPAPRMPGYVYELDAVGKHLDAATDHLVHDAIHSLLVAGNRARGEDQDVAGRELDLGMVVAGDARERGARLALTAGQDHNHPVAR